MPRIKNILEKDFNFLFTNNEFWYDDEDVELHEFVAIITNNKIKLRFILDKVNFYCDVNYINRNDNWYNIYDILAKYYKEESKMETIKPINRIKNVKSIIINKFPLISRIV